MRQEAFSRGKGWELNRLASLLAQDLSRREEARLTRVLDGILVEVDTEIGAFVTVENDTAETIEHWSLEISGFFWPGNSAKWLAGTAWAVVEPVGSGQIILFHHDPNFRLAWRATSRLFANAVLFGPSLGRGGGRF